MLGAILGDIAGSIYEFHPTNNYDFDFLKSTCSFTDDSICTVAIADALLQGADYGQSLHRWCRKYPTPMGGYGGSFRQWILNDEPQPYHSFGNGAAMRVSPVAWAKNSMEEVLSEAKKTAECTHNHPEGIKGAQTVALAIYKGREWSATQAEISQQAIDNILQACVDFSGYDLNIQKENVENVFDETCQGTVPVALWIIGRSHHFEDALRKAVSLGADADTLGAIVGSIAEAIWGIPEALKSKVMAFLPTEIQHVVAQFNERYIQPAK